MSQFKELVSSEKPVLIDFFATWCGPCQTMSPVLEDVKNELKSDIRIVKVDVDKNQQLTRKYKIQSVPSFLLFKEGEILWRGAGLHTRADMVRILKKALK